MLDSNNMEGELTEGGEQIATNIEEESRDMSLVENIHLLVDKEVKVKTNRGGPRLRNNISKDGEQTNTNKEKESRDKELKEKAKRGRPSLIKNPSDNLAPVPWLDIQYSKKEVLENLIAQAPKLNMKRTLEKIVFGVDDSTNVQNLLKSASKRSTFNDLCETVNWFKGRTDDFYGYEEEEYLAKTILQHVKEVLKSGYNIQ